MKTFNQLCSEIAELEGKKSQSAIGNIRETLSALTILVAKYHNLNVAGLYEDRLPLQILVELAGKKAKLKKYQVKTAK